jgi:hypothetical protein
MTATFRKKQYFFWWEGLIFCCVAVILLSDLEQQKQFCLLLPSPDKGKDSQHEDFGR